MEAEAAAKAEALLLKATKARQGKVERGDEDQEGPQRSMSDNSFEEVWTSNSAEDSAMWTDVADKDGECSLEDNEEEGAQVGEELVADAEDNTAQDKSKDV